MSEKIHIENATNLTINLESSNQFQEDLLTLQQAITNMQNEINQLKSPKPETKQKDKPKKTETPGKITNKQQ
jgi:predicted DNA binding CopG/RHH family protein